LARVRASADRARPLGAWFIGLLLWDRARIEGLEAIFQLTQLCERLVPERFEQRMPRIVHRDVLKVVGGM
jgi:hypothetical protein